MRGISEEDTNDGSEYGGVAGLVQPPPHELTPSELRSQISRSGDPADPTSGADIITERVDGG